MRESDPRDSCEGPFRCSMTDLMPVKAELPGVLRQHDRECGCGTGVPSESDPGDAPVLGRLVPWEASLSSGLGRAWCGSIAESERQDRKCGESDPRDS